MQKLGVGSPGGKRNAKAVQDFSEQLRLLERMHSQLRSVLPGSAATEGQLAKDFEGDQTLSFSSRGSLNGLLLSEHHEIRDNLRQIEQLAGNYHSMMQLELQELHQRNRTLEDRNRQLQRQLKQSRLSR